MVVQQTLFYRILGSSDFFLKATCLKLQISKNVFSLWDITFLAHNNFLNCEIAFGVKYKLFTFPFFN